VALFTIPQGMAYASSPASSGDRIYAAVMAVTLGAAFGSSELLMNGPTNAISAMLAANAALLASQGDPARVVVILTLFIGISQLAASLLRLGSFSRS